MSNMKGNQVAQSNSVPNPSQHHNSSQQQQPTPSHPHNQTGSTSASSTSRPESANHSTANREAANPSTSASFSSDQYIQTFLEALKAAKAVFDESEDYKKYLKKKNKKKKKNTKCDNIKIFLDSYKEMKTWYEKIFKGECPWGDSWASWPFSATKKNADVLLKGQHRVSIHMNDSDSEIQKPQPKGHNEEPVADYNDPVRKSNSDTESLKRKIKDLESELQDVKRGKYEGEMKRYREERDAAKQYLQQIQVENNRYRNERDVARQEISQIQADNNRKVTQLEHDRSEFEKRCQELQRSKEDMATRLAQEMGNKLAADESSVENVSIKNRPMNIADDYNLFCSNEWLDAKTAVDDKMAGKGVPEQHKLQMLHHIILVSYSEADAVIGTIKLNTDTLFKKLYAPDQFCTEEDPWHSPLGNLSDRRSTIATDSRKMTPAEMKKLTQSAVPIQSKKSSKIMLEATEPRAPTELTNSVGDFLRNTADIVHLDGIIQHVLRKLDEESQSLTATSPGKGKKGEQPAQTEYMQLWPYVREEAPVKQYIVKAVKLAWKMVIQRPKMNFSPAETEWKGEKYQDVYWGSDMTTKKPHVYEVFPRVCHGDKAMSKAKVYLVNPKAAKGKSPSKPGSDNRMKEVAKSTQL